MVKRKQQSTTELFSKGLAIFSLVAFAIVGIFLLAHSFAAPRTTATQTINLYLNPSSQRLVNGQTIPVSVRVNTLSRTASAVQANIKYDPNYLEYVSTDDTSSPFDVVAQNRQTPGLVEIARGSFAGVTGDQLVTTVNFKPLQTTKKTQLIFATDSAIVDASTQQNMAQKLLSASYSIR